MQHSDAPGTNQAVPQMTTKPKSVLLIVDDLMVRQAIGQVLAFENYHVVPAVNRDEAVREIGQYSIDIILLDLNPRGENGQEAFEHLSALQPHLPVVAMTARPEQYQPTFKAQGVDVLLEK